MEKVGGYPRAGGRFRRGKGLKMLEHIGKVFGDWFHVPVLLLL